MAHANTHTFDLPGTIVRAQQAGAIGTAHLLRAASAGRCDLFVPVTDTSNHAFKTFAASVRNRPAVVLIGDDDYADRGPAAWRIAERVIRWAAAVTLHGAAAELAHYEAVIFAAQITGRAVIVECSSATLPAWVDLVKQAPHRPRTLILTPPNGVHPVAPARSQMQ